MKRRRVVKKKTMAKSVAMIVFLIAVSQGAAFANWTAYNDFSTLYGVANPANVTEIDSSNSGELLDFSTGNGTGVTLDITASNNGEGVEGTGYPDDGTEAHAEFNGFVVLDGYMYSGTPTFTLTGLDPTKTYTAVFFSNRGASADKYLTRTAVLTIGGADSFNNTSTAGVSISGANNETTTTISYNTVTGYVIRYSDINPGADGIITFAATGTHNYLNAFKLTEGTSAPVDPPGSAELNISLVGGLPSVGSTSLPAAAGVTNFLQVTEELDGTWSNLYFATGVTETNWVVPSSLPKNFFRIETSY